MRATAAIFAAVLSETVRRLKRAARRYRSASRSERALLARALGTVVAARVAVTLLPFKLVSRLAARPRSTKSPDPPTPQAIAEAIESAARLVPRSSCLVQALAGQALMRRYGHPCRLSIGVVRTGAGRFDAHAWLDTDSGPLIGNEDLEAYTTLLTSPSS
jgi:Transglutaminase-like superfamily